MALDPSSLPLKIDIVPDMSHLEAALEQVEGIDINVGVDAPSLNDLLAEGARRVREKFPPLPDVGDSLLARQSLSDPMLSPDQDWLPDVGDSLLARPPLPKTELQTTPPYRGDEDGGRQDTDWLGLPFPIPLPVEVVNTPLPVEVVNLPLLVEVLSSGVPEDFAFPAPQKGTETVYPKEPTSAPEPKGDKGSADTEALLGAALGGVDVLGQAGGMIGEAIGGPIGSIIGAYIGKILPDLLASPLKAVLVPLKTFSDTLKSLGELLGPITAGFTLASASMEYMASVVKSIPVVGELFGPLVDELAGIPRLIEGIIETFAGFTQFANPAQMKMLTIAVEDTQAVIGRAFLPVLEMMREGIRAAGDALANFLPNTAEVAAALAPLRAELMALFMELRMAMTELGPIIREVLIVNIYLLAQALTMVVRYWITLTQAIRSISGPLAEFLKTLGIAGDFRSSWGAAAREAKITGIEAYEQEFQTKAYMLPGTPTEGQMPVMMSNLVTAVGDLIKWAQSLTPEKIAQAIAGALPGLRDFHMPGTSQQAVQQGIQQQQQLASSVLGGLMPRGFGGVK